MGTKLTSRKLKKITDVAKVIRKDAGVKDKKTVVVTTYKMAWKDAIKKASKIVLNPDERKPKQTKLKFKASAKPKRK